MQIAVPRSRSTVAASRVASWDRGLELWRQIIRIDEIEDDVLELRKTPAYLKARVVIDRRQLSDKRLHAVVDLPGFHSIQIYGEEGVRDLLDSGLDGPARLGDQLGVFREESFVLLVCGD